MSKWAQGVAGVLAAAWIGWVSYTLFTMNADVAAIKVRLGVGQVADAPHPHPNHLLAAAGR